MSAFFWPAAIYLFILVVHVAIPGRWVDGAGFAFSPEAPPGLQGTEMWLSIVATGADLLGMGAALPYVPRGVHRLMPEGPHPAGDLGGSERPGHPVATPTT